jgi:hypothetical protein
MQPTSPKLSAKLASALAALGLLLSCYAVTGCGDSENTSAAGSPTPSTTSAATATATPSTVASIPSPSFTPGAPGLRADPNPVRAERAPGKTMISWQSGSEDVSEVYLAEPGGERLFARGAFGSAEAPWINVGSTRFRLYRGTEHKELLAELTVTMTTGGSSAASSAAASPKP